MRRITYIYQLKNWPDFTWKDAEIAPLLADARHQQGRLLGKMEQLGFDLQTEASLQTMTLEVVKSSEIEGESLNPDQVRSSLARHLGLEVAGLIPSERNVDGIVEMMIDATQNSTQPLDQSRLFGWHASLFPTGYSGMSKIIVGNWRRMEHDPMQVVSGPHGKERVHFEAPPAEKLEKEMMRFLSWFNAAQNLDPVIKASIAHFWFVTIHPFADGNGRIARAIGEMQLARADETSKRFYSMSAQIRKERNEYYDILEASQKDSLDITNWISWFLGCYKRAIQSTDETLTSVTTRSAYWTKLTGIELNPRQKLMIQQLTEGFFGKLNSSKWARITKTSTDTALRDIRDLIGKGILIQEEAGGRSTSYKLKDIQ